MAKNHPTENRNKLNTYPDPVFFSNFFCPLVDEWVSRHGGMENMLKDPTFAKHALQAVQDLRSRGAESWVTSNFSVSHLEISDSFNKIEQACQERTDLGGETDDSTRD